MGIFNRLRKLGGKGKEEPTPAPAPEATPAPAPQAPAGGEARPKKRGLLGRLSDRVRGKKPPAAPPEEPPAAPPAAPPAPPQGPPSPPAPPPAEGPGEGPEGEGEAEEAAPEKDYSDAPSSISVKIAGTWQMSKKQWIGVVKGSLSGGAVVDFLKALDQDREKDAVIMICEAFDEGSGFADAVDLDRSDWTRPQF
jgi:hypothetical protein